MRLDDYKQQFSKAAKQYFDKVDVSFVESPIYNPDADVLSIKITVGDNHVMLDESINQIKRGFNEDIEMLAFRMSKELHNFIKKRRSINDQSK